MIEGRTVEQKRKIAQEITDTLVRVAGGEGRGRSDNIVDHPRENLATAGQLLSEREQKRASLGP